jgi:hypothetical protein
MNPLGGMFQEPEQKRTFGQRAMGAVRNFGAGLAGFGPEFIAMQRQEQQQLDEQRQKAMAKDAMTVYQLLNDNKIDDAISLVDRRVKYISELGGDPSDTLEIRQMLATPGRLNEARQELGMFVQAAMENGLLPVPERAEPLSANQVINGQVVTPEGSGYRATPVTGFQAEAENARAANMGLSPVWLQDESGAYVPAQLSSAGGMTPLQVPQGMRAVPPSGQLGFDPNAIVQRGQAQTGVDVARVEQLTTPEAQRAAAIRAAEGSAAGATERAQAIINTGVESASTIPVISRSLELLNEISTGGFESVSIKARSLFGIESADEGELTYNLARNVLQQLRPTFGSAFTEREGRTLTQIEAGLGRNTETNKRILQQVLRIAEGAVEKAYDRAVEAGDEPTAKELERALDMIYVPPIPAAYSDQITDDIWRTMTREERDAFMRAN